LGNDVGETFGAAGWFPARNVVSSGTNRARPLAQRDLTVPSAHAKIAAASCTE
jgi:hypothetical protein